MIKRWIALILCCLMIPLPVLADYETELKAFPATWQKALSAIHEKYPQWVFVAVKTGLEWDEAVSAQIGKKSLVEKYYSPLLRNTGEGHYNPENKTYTYHDASTWVSAGGWVVDYFMNPVNFLNEQYIFQFEALSYDKTYHTLEGVELILEGTFMHKTRITYVTAEGETVETEKTYGEVMMEAAEESGVSPYYIASKIRTEIGIKPSGSVSGTYPGYPGVYNFYNIGANDGENPIANGLNWASLGTSYGRPWTTPEASIINGAVWLGALYISKGQNTMYFERFNVSPNSGYALYTHQYMTNIYGAAGQALSTYKGYEAAGSLGDAKVFYIPVYENMPESDGRVSFEGVTEQMGISNSNGNVNVRSGPAVFHDRCGSMAPGEVVKILSATRTDSTDRMDNLKNPCWYKIQSGSVTGYVSAEYITPLPAVQLLVGETFDLRPAAQGGSGRLYWENLDRTVAEVDKSGVITAKKSGEAVLYARTSGGGMAAVCVKVLKGDGFRDMNGHWAEAVVKSAAELGVFTGTSETEFSPELPMTRSMFITVLFRLAKLLYGCDGGNTDALPYLDIDPAAWYAEPIAWAYEENVIPFSDGVMFCPSMAVTRLEMALAAYYLAEAQGEAVEADMAVGTGFADFETLHQEAKKAVAWCLENNVLRGMGDGTLGMDETATRAQVAQIAINIYNALGM